MNFQRLSEDKLKLVINNILNTKDGRELFSHLLANSGMFQTGINGNSKDVYIKGRADFGLEIRDLIMENDFNSYIKMLQETEEALRQENKKKRKGDDND